MMIENTDSHHVPIVKVQDVIVSGTVATYSVGFTDGVREDHDIHIIFLREGVCPINNRTLYRRADETEVLDGVCPVLDGVAEGRLTTIAAVVVGKNVYVDAKTSRVVPPPPANLDDSHHVPIVKAPEEVETSDPMSYTVKFLKTRDKDTTVVVDFSTVRVKVIERRKLIVKKGSKSVTASVRPHLVAGAKRGAVTIEVTTVANRKKRTGRAEVAVVRKRR